MRKLSNNLAALVLATIPSGIGAVAAENAKKLSGTIRAQFSGMQLTDGVHWRYVYERDGTLKSYSMEPRRLANGPSKRTNSAFFSRSSMMVVTRFSLRAKRSR